VAHDRDHARVGDDEVGDVDRFLRVGAVVVRRGHDFIREAFGGVGFLHRELDGAAQALPLGAHVAGERHGDGDLDDLLLRAAGGGQSERGGEDGETGAAGQGHFLILLK
jgi:hypothetical protein